MFSASPRLRRVVLDPLVPDLSTNYVDNFGLFNNFTCGYRPFGLFLASNDRIQSIPSYILSTLSNRYNY